MVVIGVTDEGPELVEQWIADKKPEYPIISLKDGRFEDFLNVEFFPTVAVINPDGTLGYTGSSRGVESALELALSKAESGPLYPKSLAKIAKYMEKGEDGKAYETLLKLVESGKVPEADMAHLEMYRGYLEGLAANALAEAKRQDERGYIFRAVNCLAPYVEGKTVYPATEDCRAFLTELEARPDFKDEMKGGQAFEEAWSLMGERKFTDGIKACAGIAKKYDGTRIGERARAVAEKYVEDGLYGFEDSCEKCYDAKRACAKHKQNYKL